jgi:hypothetical protein
MPPRDICPSLVRASVLALLPVHELLGQIFRDRAHDLREGGGVAREEEGVLPGMEPTDTWRKTKFSGEGRYGGKNRLSRARRGH